MKKSTKKFYITRTCRKYDGTPYYRPSVYQRFETWEEAVAKAARLNQEDSRENSEAIYRRWVADPDAPHFDEAWFERKKNQLFYYTYEAKASK